MLRYGRYARKSKDDSSVTEKSIGEQVAACNQVTHILELITVMDWEESQSARTPGIRPFYKELISEVRAGHIERILCWHINRLVRNMQEIEKDWDFQRPLVRRVNQESGKSPLPKLWADKARHQAITGHQTDSF